MSHYYYTIPRASSSATLPPLPSNLVALFLGVDAVLTRNRSGTGNSITDSGASCTLTCPTGAFTADDVPQWITLSNWNNAGNNGTFRVSASPTGTTLTIANPTAVTETKALGQWQLHGRVSSITDRVSGLVATPPSTAGSLVADITSETSGKVLVSSIDGALLFCSVVDSGVLGVFSGNVDCSIWTYGKRLDTGTAIIAGLTNAAGNRFIRVNFAGATAMRMPRNDGTADSTDIVNTAAVNDLTMRRWAWCYDNTTSGALQAFKDDVSLGAPVAPFTKTSPLAIDTLRLGSTTSSEAFTWRAMAFLSSYTSAADQAMLTAYVNAVYA